MSIFTRFRVRLVDKTSPTFEQQLRLMLQNGPGDLLAGMLAAVIFSVSAWTPTNHNAVLFWIATYFLQLAYVYYGQILKFAKVLTNKNVLGRLAWAYAVSALIAGLIWGLGAAYFIDPSDRFREAVMVAILCMVGAGSIPGRAPFIPAMAMFVIPCLLPLAVVLAVQHDQTHLALGIGVVVFLGLCLSTGVNFNKLILRGASLALQNENLVAQLRSANIAKTKFFAAASHDLRQPVHAVGLLIGALREHVNDDQGREVLSKVEASVDAIDQLFTALLDISKLDSGVVVPEVSEFAIDPLLQTIVLQCAPEAQSKGVKLRRVRCSARVLTDPVLLERILRNLVVNAVRYSSGGKVLIGCKQRAKKLCLEVWDQGIGIAPDQQTRIFEEFVRLPGAQESAPKGLGLGLSIVRRYCDLLGLSIVVQSERGRGSRFVVSLPFVGRQHERLASRNRSAEGAYGAFVVVVDDDEDILFGMGLLLKRMGCHIVCARSGRDAVQGLSEHMRLPDLVISDFALADGETGIDAISLINNALGLRVPAIVITGTSSPETLQRIAVEGYHVVLKPTSEDRLRAIIRGTLMSAEGKDVEARSARKQSFVVANLQMPNASDQL